MPFPPSFVDGHPQAAPASRDDPDHAVLPENLQRNLQWTSLAFSADRNEDLPDRELSRHSLRRCCAVSGHRHIAEHRSLYRQMDKFAVTAFVECFDAARWYAGDGEQKEVRQELFFFFWFLFFSAL